MIAKLKKWWKELPFKYDHTQCVIKKINHHPSKKPERILFYGKQTLLQPGHYSVSCKTPDGYKIKYLRTKEQVLLNIKSYILK